MKQEFEKNLLSPLPVVLVGAGMCQYLLLQLRHALDDSTM
jgi:hypothetical protein